MKIDMYPHNAEVYDKVKLMLEKTGKAAVVHPTGTGKSYLAFALAEENPKLHVLWLAPNEFIYTTQCQNLFEKQHLRYPNITFMTYPWLNRHKDEINAIKPEIIILDEFHRAGATQWGIAVDKLLKAFPKAWVLGLTATNVRYLDGHRDMAQELFDGFVVSKIGLCEAMAKGILPTPKYVIGVYKFDDKMNTYQSRIDEMPDPEKKKLSQEALDKLKRKLLNAGGMDKIFPRHITEKNSKFIIFCSSIGHAYEMIGKVPEWFCGIDLNPHVYFVNTENEMSQKELLKFIEDDSDHLKLLFSVDMLNEGVHVENIDGVILLRPTKSPALYKQQIGRALCTGSRKKPIIFDLVNNFDNLYNIESVREEWEDARIAYQRQYCDEQEEMEFEIYDEIASCRELIRQLECFLAKPWDVYYNAYTAYIDETASNEVATRYVTRDGLYLGKWLVRQRSLNKMGRLTIDQVERLNLLGIRWDVKRREPFDYWYALLCDFYKENGHSVVPLLYETQEGEKLGRWVAKVRRDYRAGVLPPNEKETLDKLKFWWDVKDAWWEEGFQHAKKYYDIHKKLDVPKDYISEDGYKLGNWITRQKKNRKGSGNGIITEERIRRLEEIGLSWNKVLDDRYNEQVQLYVRFVREFKTPIVPIDCVYEGKKLGAWVERQKIAYKAGKLERSRIRKLEKVGFVWEMAEKTWNERYEDAKEYYKKHGNLHMRHKDLQGKQVLLYEWIMRQDWEYSKENHGKLTEEQVRLLEEINISIRTEGDVRWDRGYRNLKRYYEEHGNSLLRYNYTTEDGFNLGEWVKQQREKYAKGKLPDQRIKLLEELDMEWGNMLHIKAEIFWKKMYEEAKEYFEKNGCLPPVTYTSESGLKLGQWLAQQRRIYKGNIKHSIDYTPERVKMMEDIGMKW